MRTWLTTLATYLNDNATTPRALGGRPLSGTDIVLHELWPLAGTRRLRAVTLAMLAVVWLIASLLLLRVRGSVSLSALPTLTVGVLVVIFIVGSYYMWANIWPGPKRANLNLRTSTGRRRLAGGLGYGLALGLAGWLADGSRVGLVVGLAIGLAGVRYIALLLCTRKCTTRWLPRRLGTFLDWCYTIGLTRKAGIAYQFRHRELQDYLAQHRTT